MLHIKYLYKTERLEQVMGQLTTMRKQKEEYESLLRRSEENVDERLKSLTANLSKQIQDKEDIVKLPRREDAAKKRRERRGLN